MKKKEEIRIIVNNNFHGIVYSPKEALGTVISLGLTRLELMSDDAIKNWLIGAMDMVVELIGPKGDARVKRLITNAKKYLDKELTREQLLKFFTDTILSSEGHSTLSGFGIAKTSTTEGRKKGKAAYGINAERISINEVE